MRMSEGAHRCGGRCADEVHEEVLKTNKKKVDEPIARAWEQYRSKCDEWSRQDRRRQEGLERAQREADERCERLQQEARDAARLNAQQEERRSAAHKAKIDQLKGELNRLQEERTHRDDSKFNFSDRFQEARSSSERFRSSSERFRRAPSFEERWDAVLCAM